MGRAVRVPLVCLALALSAGGMCACSSAKRTTVVGGVAGLPRRDRDGDVDGFAKSPYDGDRDAMPIFGPPAGVADRRAIEALVRRYYAFAAAGDGRRACAMLYAVTEERLVEEHHQGQGSVSQQGDACGRILSELFRQSRRELSEDFAAYRVLVVQVRGARGIALMRFGTPPDFEEFEVLVHREHGGWRMAVPLDEEAV